MKKGITFFDSVLPNVSLRIFELLNLKVSLFDQNRIQSKKSSLEEWQAEAKKLEAQGKMEQVEDIYQRILQYKKVPWQIFEREKCAEQIEKIFNNPALASAKNMQHLYEEALMHEDYMLLRSYHSWRIGNPKEGKNGFLLEEKMEAARTELISGKQKLISEKTLAEYQDYQWSYLQKKIVEYGPDFRNSHNWSGLMAAAFCGSSKLVLKLIEQGAHLNLENNYRQRAFEIFLLRGADSSFSTQEKSRIYQIWQALAPEEIKLHFGNRQWVIYKHQGEFLLFWCVFFLLKKKFLRSQSIYHNVSAPEMDEFMHNFLSFDFNPEFRFKRSYWSHLLSKNELFSMNAQQKPLFFRIHLGRYQLNPFLKWEDEFLLDYFIESPAQKFWKSNYLNLKAGFKMSQYSLKMIKLLSNFSSDWDAAKSEKNADKMQVLNQSMLKCFEKVRIQIEKEYS